MFKHLLYDIYIEVFILIFYALWVKKGNKKMVNGITNISTSPQIENTTTTSTTKTVTNNTYSEESAIYIASDSTDLTSLANASEVDRANIIEQMKADADNQTQQLQDLVEKMFLQQGNASIFTKSLWQKLVDDNLITDQEAITKAQEDVSEDGYWGVEQTSNRILSFAVALSGGDEELMEEMTEAFKKGFEQATQSWGDELPQLSQDTYDAVLQKFDDWFQTNSETSSETD